MSSSHPVNRDRHILFPSKQLGEANSSTKADSLTGYQAHTSPPHPQHRGSAFALTDLQILR
jgi:hypothetical protein